MKLTIALLLISLVQVSANGLSQSITLKLNNAELKKALFIIERKANCRFLYNDDAISSVNTKVTINVENTRVTNILNEIFAGTNLTYKLLDNHLIVLSAKENLIQDIKIKGKVSALSGESVPAATIRVKGTNVVISADANGNFSITAPENGTLVISSIGYNQIEIPVTGRTEINVILTASEKVLDQVVVVGYGSQRKIDITGAVVQIKGEEVAKQSTFSPISALQGKVAGVQITNSGSPGSAPEIRIRGVGTVYGNANPLYVVDGIWYDDISFLNSADIDNISVLKDASSESIYGIRAANGVILITTKKGRKGEKAVISYNGYVGNQVVTNQV
ncbi:MAG TPA: TonB-dependent receptor plug domain-containing protein, partial [Chitinophagaceae bacterium]|nr:TonB-dependent receptor plug domain-containing protein [Chitinophagaceae bacterium]